MILLIMLALSVLLVTPLMFAFRRPRFLQNRRVASMALYRAQLVELSRDLAEARIGAAEYTGAKLEVERRLLAADATATPAYNGDARLLLIATAVAVPIAAFALYLPGSTPTIPSEPHTQWLAQQAVQRARLDTVISKIREHLASVDPHSVDASQGEAYLAEALAERAGTITPEALKLFRQSLANAPGNASWRVLDEQRIVQAGQ